ncbi:trigger factor [Corynebacterium freiburgense]|uniref:trigger factor n=1 Tax=Corynebacterium freiburgense TaxID=556548 RepID=UPI00047EB060|nr:trigger factor [Corynebacterium freiburgense]WJZ03412.1 Trigger factor [Corynebacterium freiburgense]
MKSSVEHLNDTRVKLTVEVPFDEMKPEFDQAYEAIAQQVSIPGFRKGKAPRQLIEARVGRGPILEQVLNDVVPSRYEKAVEENKLVVLGSPALDLSKVEDDEFIEFVAEVDIRPEIQVPDFSEISVEVPAIEVTDEKISERLDVLRERFASLTEVDQVVAEGNFVTLDMSASVDGQVIEESATEDLSYEVGSKDLVEGLDEALIGMAKGETKEFTTNLVSGEYEGKESAVTVTVKSVKVRELPELDDEFAEMASEFDTIEELKTNIAGSLEDEGKNEQAGNIRDEVLKAALEQTEFPLPEGVVQAQVDGHLQQLMSQFGGKEEILEQMLQIQGTTREEFDADSRKNAEEAVRTQLFLDVLADQEQPSVTQQDFTDHIIFTAQSYGMEPEQFVNQLQQSGQLANVFTDVRRGKALAAAIARVTAKDSNGEAIDVKSYFGPEEEAEAEA